MHRILVTVAVACLTLAPAVAQSPSATLAPTGTLRGIFLAGNPVQARVDPNTGVASGPVPDLIQELARRLNVPAAPIPAQNSAEVIAAVMGGAADVGFLAYEEARAREVDYGAPFLVMLSSYLVEADSGMRVSADVDRPGVVVASFRGATQQLFVSRELTSAEVRVFDRMPPQAEVERLLISGEVQVFAINRQRALEAQAASESQLRALADSFLNVEQRFVVELGNRAKLEVIEQIVAELNESGFIRSSIERAKLAGVEAIAPGR